MLRCRTWRCQGRIGEQGRDVKPKQSGALARAGHQRMPDEFHELLSEYENYVEWCHKGMTPRQLELSSRVLEKLRQADATHVCLDEIEQEEEKR